MEVGLCSPLAWPAAWCCWVTFTGGGEEGMSRRPLVWGPTEWRDSLFGKVLKGPGVDAFSLKLKPQRFMQSTG